MMENENEFFTIVLILEISHKIIHEGNKYCNVLFIQVHTLPRTHAHKKNHIQCVYDKENSRLYCNQFSSYNYHTLQRRVTYNISMFHQL